MSMSRAELLLEYDEADIKARAAGSLGEHELCDYYTNRKSVAHYELILRPSMN